MSTLRVCDSGRNRLGWRPVARQTHRRCPLSAGRLLERLLELPAAEAAPSRLTGGPALWVEGREFLHLHGDEAEIRLTRKLISQLDDPRVTRRTRTSD